MLHMNGFTMGFFFPRQIAAEPLIDLRKENIADARGTDKIPASDDKPSLSIPAPLGMIAYRFF